MNHDVTCPFYVHEAILRKCINSKLVRSANGQLAKIRKGLTTVIARKSAEYSVSNGPNVVVHTCHIYFGYIPFICMTFI